MKFPKIKGEDFSTKKKTYFERVLMEEDPDDRPQMYKNTYQNLLNMSLDLTILFSSLSGSKIQNSKISQDDEPDSETASSSW